MEHNMIKKSVRGAQISVIVPVYKVEPYLRCCIDSILAQTFADFELILVDDGSPDNCGAICDEYAAKDDRIVVIHQENQGLSAARNAGIDWCMKYSNSLWLTFVDSDDAIVPKFLETVYHYAEETAADTVAAHGYGVEDGGDMFGFSQEIRSVMHLSGREWCMSHYRREKKVSIYACGKLFRKSIFLNLRFPEGKLFEDEALIPKVVYQSDVVVLVDAWLYCYRQRQDSIVHVPFSLRRIDHLEGMDSCIAYFKEKHEPEIAGLAEKRKLKYVAKYVLLAHGAKMSKMIPHQYRMSRIRAVCITLAETVRQGGVKYIAVRVRQFFKRIRPGK